MKRTIAPVGPRPLASAMVASVYRSLAMKSMIPTATRPLARRATPGGNDRAGRIFTCSRQVGGTATRTSTATPAVAPTDSTSWAEAGRRTSV